jgi:hypothetical protein
VTSCLQDGVPTSIADPWNPAAALAAGVILCFASPRGAAWRILLPVAEAATIGAWAVTGTEKAADLGIASLSAVLLGVISAVGGGAIRDVVVLSRVPEVFGGNTLTATCAAASAVVMIIAYRVHHPAVGLGPRHRHRRRSLSCRSPAPLGTAIGRTPACRNTERGSRRFHRAGAASAEPEHSDAVARGLIA